MDFTNYIMPELLITVPALYFIGYIIKRTMTCDKHIPLILTGVGIVLALLWIGSQPLENVPAAVFTAIVQGVLCAGMAVYSNQIVKQNRKDD